MSATTHIQWTEKSWNPTLGCDKVSKGCNHCYAIDAAHRLAQNPNPKIQADYEGLTVLGSDGTPQWTGKVRSLPDRLTDPLKWRKPARIFVNSMSDLFHESVPFEFIAAVFGVMAACPQHDFQLLTKRPERALEWFAWLTASRDQGHNASEDLICQRHAWAAGAKVPLHPIKGTFKEHTWPLPNVWFGISVEDQKRADERLPILTNIPATVRWLSIEPLLGPVDISRWLAISWQCSGCHEFFHGPLQDVCPACGRKGYWCGSHKFNPPRRQTGSAIDWVVVGGESGKYARPMHPDWARSLRDQCVEAGVPFFFKQQGEWSWDNTGPGRIAQVGRDGWYETGAGYCGYGCDHPGSVQVWRVGKKLAGRLLDGREWNEYPEVRS